MIVWQHDSPDPALPSAWTAANSNCKSCNLSAACRDAGVPLALAERSTLRPPFRFSQLHLKRLPVSKLALEFVIQAKTPTVQ
ncbi:MAG: hypothetical protein WCC03_01830 [Candidatus Acidiferrales bacterium]